MACEPGPLDLRVGTRRQGGITKAGNGAARRMLTETAWSYSFPLAGSSCCSKSAGQADP
jgi:transposase